MVTLKAYDWGLCIRPNGQIPDGNVDITVEDRVKK